MHLRRFFISNFDLYIFIIIFVFKKIGDNIVLTQQVGRHLLKCYGNVKRGKKVTGTCSYLNDFKEDQKVRCKADTIEQLQQLENLLHLFAHRSSRMIFSVGKSFDESSRKLSFQEAWNFHLSDFIKLNEAHCTYMSLRAFIARLQDLQDPSLLEVLTPLCQLYALVNIEEKLGDFVVDGLLSASQANLVNNAIKHLLQKIRPNALALVDSFDFSDYYLNSSLGRFDGNVYEDLFARAKQCPLNKTEVSDAYTKHLSRLIKGKVFSNL